MKSLTRLLSRYPFLRSTKPYSSFLTKPTTRQSPFFRTVMPTFQVRPFGGNASRPDFDETKVNKVVDEINLKFAEAREEIEMAMESKETVYFDEEAVIAREAVQVVLDMFDGLMEKLDDNEKGKMMRSMGMKIEQLKAELGQLNE